MGCYLIQGAIWICGDADDPHCSECMDFGDYLCDYPVGEGKTCDRALCDKHRGRAAYEIDYCPTHFSEYQVFVKENDLTKHFENVALFRDAKSLVSKSLRNLEAK